jgi:hypothetical protein
MFLYKRNGVYYLQYDEPKTGRIKRIYTKKNIKKVAQSFVRNFEKEYLAPKTESSSPSYFI